MSAKKQLFMPSRFNYKTLRSEPQTLAGYTGDGRVGLTPQAFDLLCGIEMSHEDAQRLAEELLIASADAHRAHNEANGLNEWVARPISGARFEVRHHGHVGIFRPIVNGKRRGAGYVDPSQDPRGHRCTVCRKEAPEGATMYVFDRSTEKRGTYDPVASAFRHDRACEQCMRPDLGAALIGAALLAAAPSSEAP